MTQDTPPSWSSARVPAAWRWPPNCAASRVDVTVVDAAGPPAHRLPRHPAVAPGTRGARRTRPGRAAARDGVRPAALHYHLGSGGSVLRVPLTSGRQRPPGPAAGTHRPPAGPGPGRPGRRPSNGAPGSPKVAPPRGRHRYRDPDGRHDTEIEADWVIGADGLHSRVRDELGIDFSGARFPATFLLAEGSVEGEASTEEIHYFLADSGVSNT